MRAVGRHRVSLLVGRRCYSSSTGNSDLPPKTIRALLATHSSSSFGISDAENAPVSISGFARSIRQHRKLTFLNLTDGSLPGDSTLQAVLKGDTKDQYDSQLSPGVAVELSGRLQESKGAGQAVEFLVNHLTVTGNSEASTYPLASPYSTSPASAAALLRKYAHLRPREARHAAVLRTRNVMEKVISDFFWENDFTRVAVPILTSSDCEGGGEVFSVDAAGKESLKEGSLVAQLAQEPSLSGSNADQPAPRVTDKKLKEEPSLSGSDSDATSSKGSVSFWSGSPAYLTVSSQLHLEAISLGLGRIYTVGPSFRAESSATNRHLAEFWMCEGEMITSSEATTGLEQVMAIVEALLRRVISATTSSEEADFLWNGEEAQSLRVIKSYATAESKWSRMTYTQAIDALQGANVAFELSPRRGDSLASEHERWLARDGPVFITHYPAAIKPFYMRLDEGKETVACFDLLVPRIGELVGGSLREERRDVLVSRLAEFDPVSTNLQWYTDDLRKYGCNPHGGFGIGMERLLSLVTATDNLRDCLTFPRVKGPLRF